MKYGNLQLVILKLKQNLNVNIKGIKRFGAKLKQ